MDEILRVSLAFGAYSKDSYGVFADNVGGRAYEIAGLIMPVPREIFDLAHSEYKLAVLAQPTSGPPGTARVHACRKKLTALLKKLAHYVEDNSTSMEMLLSTGFLAVNSNRAPVTLPVPSIKRITYEVSGIGLVTVTANPNSRGHEVSVAEVSEAGVIGPFRPAVASTSSLKIAIPGLIPGHLYAFKTRTFGGAATYTAWSDVVTQRAI